MSFVRTARRNVWALLLCAVSVLSLNAQEPGKEEDELVIMVQEAQEIADRLLLPRASIEDPEENDDSWQAADQTETHSIRVSQVDLGNEERTNMRQPDPENSSSPLSILKQVRRVQIPSDGDSEQPVASENPTATYAPPNSDDSGIAKQASATEKKKTGMVRNLIGHIPIIGSHMSSAGKNQKNRPDSAPKDLTNEAQQPAPETPSRSPILYPPPQDVSIGSDVSTQPVAVPLQGGGIYIPARPPQARITPIMPFNPSPRTSNPHWDGRPPILIAPPTQQTQDVSPRVQLPKAAEPAATHEPAVSFDREALVPGIPAPTTAPQPQAIGSQDDKSYSPAATKTPEIDTFSGALSTPKTLVLRDSISSPSLEANDLAMPKTALEPNDVTRSEFVAAVKEARAGQYGLASAHFREYATNHPSSKLVPRAAFLSAILDPEKASASRTVAKLRQKQPDSPYVAELERRNIGDAPEPDAIMPNETLPSQDSATYLSAQLAAIPTGPQAVQIRTQLGRIYLNQKQYDKALDVLRPGLLQAHQTALEPELMDLISEAQLSMGNSAQAMNLLSDVLQRFPQYEGKARVRLNMGLACEELGYYQRAAAEYRTLLQESPATSEARAAEARLSDLQKLSQ